MNMSNTTFKVLSVKEAELQVLLDNIKRMELLLKVIGLPYSVALNDINPNLYGEYFLVKNKYLDLINKGRFHEDNI